MYPGLKEILTPAGMSVQDHDRNPLRTTIDMRGEQTLNSDAKTSVGVTQFVSSASLVRIWAMNRSDAAETKKLSVTWSAYRIPLLFMSLRSK